VIGLASRPGFDLSGPRDRELADITSVAASARELRAPTADDLQAAILTGLDDARARLFGQGHNKSGNAIERHDLE
jgi:hypothetical protein